ACAKALRLVFGWVVVLAGYKPTPAEEMQSLIDSQNTTGTREAAKATADAKIAELQAKLTQTRPGGKAEAQVKKEMAQAVPIPPNAPSPPGAAANTNSQTLPLGKTITDAQAKRLFA